jgi:hypothetical protein
MIEVYFAASTLKATVSVLRGQRKRIRSRWKASAARHGLAYSTLSQSLEGTIDGVHVEVSLVRSLRRHSPGWSMGWDTRIEATATNAPPGLLQVRPSNTEKLRSLVGVEDLQVGDPALDDRYRITSGTPSLARQILADTTILDRMRSPEGLRLHDGTVVLQTPGVAIDDLGERITAAVALVRPIYTILDALPQRIAEQTGLQHTRFPSRNRLRFEGTIHGIAVEMVTAPSGDGMRILATENRAVRRGLMAQIEDRTEPGLYDAHDYLPVDTMDPEALARAVAQVVARARTRWTAICQEWSPLAEHTGLEPEPDPAFILPRFEGSVDGVFVTVRPHESARKVFDVVARLPHPPDIALELRARATGASPTRPLGDVILDAHIVVQTDQHRAARALLVRDRTREDLLAVLKGHPGSTVNQSRVYIPECAPYPHAVTTAVRDAVALARALSPPPPHS